MERGIKSKEVIESYLTYFSLVAVIMFVAYFRLNGSIIICLLYFIGFLLLTMFIILLEIINSRCY